MNVRLTSLRSWLLAAMLSAGSVGLVAAYFAIERIEHGSEQRTDRAKDEQIVRAIADQVVDHGVDVSELETIQRVLPFDQIVVYLGQRQVYAGPPVDADLEVSVVRRFRGGRVELFDYHTPDAAVARELTLVAAGSMLLVIAAAFMAATLLTRFLKAPIDRAAVAADRVASGDFSVRLSELEPGEFDRLARAFDSMASRLESGEVDQQRFLTDIAHELATPVNAISGLAGALLDGTITGDAERAEAAHLLESETERLDALLDDLRRLTNLDRNERVRLGPVDLSNIAKRAETRFHQAARDTGVQLTVEGSTTIVETDQSLVETVIDNFVSNALRYTPPGGRIAIRIERRGTEALLAVRDTGIGIPAEHIPRIFNRFYRVDAARDRHSGGGGLGLSLASRAASSIGARIEVESEVGSGTEFRLIMPINSPDVSSLHDDEALAE
jgi:signal transduction histidine kinase